MLKNHYVISGLLETRKNLLAELIKLISATNSNIVDCRANHVGSWYSVSILLDGSWDAVAKVETNLEKFRSKRGVKLYCERSSLTPAKQPLLPYLVQVIASDIPNLTDDILQFFMHEKLPLRELETNIQVSTYTDTPIYSLSMMVHVPVDTDIGELRERFIVFCDELNVDAVMEPLK